VDFEDDWLTKSSFITKDEIKFFSYPGPKFHTQKKNKKPIYYDPVNKKEG
jgi:hypothetical protein